MQFFAIREALCTFLGTHRWEWPCATRVARRLAGPASYLSQRLRLWTCTFSCTAIRRDGNAYLRGKQAPLFIFQCRSDYGFPSLHRHEALRGTELHALIPRFRQHLGVSVRSQRDAAKGLQPVGNTHRQTDGALGGTLRCERSAGVVL